MTEDNRIVNALWVGKTFSLIELLTLYSFTYHGHIVQLWMYGKKLTNLPPGVIIMDANLIIPEAEIFYKKHKDPVAGVGKGSIGAPFSDLFRYKLLYEHGGWWVDMDVTCIKQLDIVEPYFFRNHLILDVIGNVMKCPKGSELMKRTYDEVKATCNENTVDWLQPNKILNKHIHKLGLIKYIKTGVSNRDEWGETKKFIRTGREIPNDWLIIHWTNEEFRMNRIDKNHFRLAYSTLGSLLKKYKVPLEHRNFFKVIRNEIILMAPGKYIKEFFKRIFCFFYYHISFYFKSREERKRIRSKNA